jgi:hypothetical protein
VLVSTSLRRRDPAGKQVPPAALLAWKQIPRARLLPAWQVLPATLLPAWNFLLNELVLLPA